MRRIKNNSKFIVGIMLAAFVIGLVIIRIGDIKAESKREVFNIERINQDAGFPVETMIAESKSGIVKEPLFVDQGAAFVSGTRIAKFKPGQKVGASGRVVSVNKNVDLDTGLYALRVSGASGATHIEIECAGFFIPVSAVSNNSVMVSADGKSVRKNINIICQDSEYVVVSGLVPGDIVILSKVDENVKVRGI